MLKIFFCKSLIGVEKENPVSIGIELVVVDMSDKLFYNHNNYHPPVMYEFRIIPDIFFNVINEFTGIMEYREYFCKLV